MSVRRIQSWIGGEILAAIASASSVFVASIFVVAAANKLYALGRFREELEDYELLPGPLTGVAAIALPLVELLAATAAFVPAMRIAGAFALLALLAVFSAAIAINLRRGHAEIRCACFGESSQTLSWVVLLRNGLLALGLIPAVLVPAETATFLTFAGAVGALLGAAIGWLVLEAAQLGEVSTARGGQEP